MDGHRHSVLLTEDDADTQEALRLLLEQAGYDVIGVSHGRDALAALRGGARPCVILLDLAMPDMNGFEFRRAQLADPALEAIPVIVLSAGGHVNQADARKLGMDKFFRKPLDIDALADAVHRACNREPA